MTADPFALELDKTAVSLVRLLKRLRLPLNTEAAAQDAIERALLDAEFDYKREWSLGDHGRIDFMVDAADGPGVGIEVKIKSPRRALAEQLLRYAEHERVGALICVSNVMLPLPGTLAGKDVYFVHAGKSWL